MDDPSNDPIIDGDNALELGDDNRGTLNSTLDGPGPSRPTGYRGRLRPVGEKVFSRESDTVSVKSSISSFVADASVEMATTFAPGDNFRVVATINTPEEIDQSNLIDGNAQFLHRVPTGLVVDEALPL